MSEHDFRARCLDQYMELPAMKSLLATYHRGSAVDRSAVERITGQPYDRLHARIAGYYWRQGITVRRRDGVPHLLTDSEQMGSAVKRINSARRTARRTAYELGGVDRDKLDADGLSTLSALSEGAQNLADMSTAISRVTSRALAAWLTPKVPPRLSSR